MKILGFVGSLRKESYNRKLMEEARKLFPPEWEFEEGVFANLPLFNQDIENPMPTEVVALQQKIKGADGILIVTPEFNRSIPGGLKNMIDWCSRGELEDCWNGRKVYIVGASSGNLGTVTAQYDLRRIMLYSGARVLGKPEFFLGKNKEKFDEMGIVDEQAKEQLHKAMSAFIEFVQQ